MAWPKTVLLTIAGSALVLSMPGSAPAQCRLCSTPTTARDNPWDEGQLTLEVESALAFGRLIVTGSGAGSAWLRPDGSTSTSGAVAAAAARAMVGSVTVRGEPGRAVRVELPSRLVLYSIAGAQIEVDDVTSDLAALPRLDSTGKLTFRFGGRVQVQGDADGDFRGELPIIVEYL